MSEQRKFDKAFKVQAVTHIISKETTISKIAEEIGVHYTTVRDWVRYYKAATNSKHNFPVVENLLNKCFTAEKASCWKDQCFKRLASFFGTLLEKLKEIFFLLPNFMDI